MRTRIVTPVLAALLLAGASLVPPATDAAKVTCAPNTSSDVYVNPVVQRSRSVTPTGVSSPAACAFRTLTDAIANAEDRGLGAGARLILTGGTAAAPAVFANESFPLSFPPGIEVTTTDDPGLGGGGLNPKAYVIQFTGRAAYAGHIEGGRLAGFTIKNERASRATIMLICDEGSAALDAVTLNGTSGSGGSISRGLHAWSGCDLETSQLRVRGAVDGVVVDEGASAFFDAATIYDNTDDGLVVRGSVSFGLFNATEIAFNGDDGVLVERSAGSAFRNMVVRNNGGNGFEIHPSNITAFLQVIVDYNSYSTGWDQPQLFFIGPPTAGVPVYVPDSGTTETGYRMGAPSGVQCGDGNRIFGYDAANPGATAVGIRAENGAIVDATYNLWVSAPKVTVAAGSYIATDPSCGSIGQPPPGPPIEE